MVFSLTIVTTSQSLSRLNVLFQVKQLEECLAYVKPHILVPDALVTVGLFAMSMINIRIASMSKNSCGSCPCGVLSMAGKVAINYKVHNKS